MATIIHKQTCTPILFALFLEFRLQLIFLVLVDFQRLHIYS